MTENNEQTPLEQVVFEASTLWVPGSSDQTASDGAPVPDRILVVPWGEVRSASGSFLADAEALAETLREFEEHGTDLPIDYEHQTLGGDYSSPTGQAPAAGWIRELIRIVPESEGRGAEAALTEPGLWADVCWTDEARARLARREYRYLSPVALVRRSDRRLVGLHSVALTNKPAIVGMKPVVNQQRPAEGESDDSESGNTIRLAALRNTLALDTTADADTVLESAIGCIQSLRHEEAHRRAADRVTAAMTEGKLTPAQREWAYELAVRDPAEFDRWSASAPRVVAPGRTAPPDEPTGGKTSDRRAIETIARAEWRANKSFLERICTEEAYVAHALRDGAAS